MVYNGAAKEATVLISGDCIPCILNMGLTIAHQAGLDEARTMSFMKSITDVKLFGGKNSHAVTSSHVILDVWSRLIAVTQDPDPLRRAKKEQNMAAMRFYPEVKERVRRSPDAIAEAAALAAMGNALDAMKGEIARPSGERLRLFSEKKVKPQAVRVFKERLRRAKKILYFGDNCGEIVFDKLLVEAIREAYAADMLFVVRSLPVLNDATTAEARSIGLHKIVPVIDNGSRVPLPGTSIKKVSPEVLTLIKEADLVIAKGGGNHDSMTEEPEFAGKTTYLFQTKCRPYAALYQTRVGTPVLHNG